MISKVKIIVVDETCQLTQALQSPTIEHDVELLTCMSISQFIQLRKTTGLADADIVIFNFPELSETLIYSCIEQLNIASIIFSQSPDKHIIQTAINAGLTTFMVDQIDPDKFAVMIYIALELFKRQQKLQDELIQAKSKLAERKDIEKAKILLMQLHQFNEDQAFQYLRKNAMHHRVRLGEIARRLLDAQQLLYPPHPLQDE